MSQYNKSQEIPKISNSLPDLEAASWLLEQLIFPSDSIISRATIRDTVEEAAVGCSGPIEETWPQWIMDSCQGLGCRCRAIDCTLEQIMGLVRNDAQIVLYSPDRGWFAITRKEHRRLLLLQPDQVPTSVSIPLRRLGQILSGMQVNGAFRCVVMGTGWKLNPPSMPTNLPPPQRLWKLLKPEWPDIWIIIVFAMIIALLALATPIAVETLVNTVAFGRFLQPVIILSLMLFVFLAFSGALRGLQTYVVEIIQRRLFARVAADIAYRLPRVETVALDGHSGRELINRFFDVVMLQKGAAQLLLDGVALVLGTLIGMAMLAFYHPWLLGYDFLLLAMIALIVIVLGRGAVQSSIKESKAKYCMAAWLEDLAGCPITFRHHGSAQFALEQADHLVFKYLTARAHHFRILMRQILFALAMQAIASTILLGLGGWLVISGQLTLGQLVAAELIVAVVVGSFAKLGKQMENFYDLLASVDKLGILFDLPVERQDGLVRLPAGASDGIEIRNTDYSYSDGQQLLKNFSLTINPTDRIAVMGPGGRGKSILLDLLYGLRTPSQGYLTIDGVDLRELRSDAIRRHVALVRDIEIFQGSIADNVRLGQFHVSAAAARKALADVKLIEDLLRLPQQLNTQLTSTGYPLSATQLRKLMLARGCARAPSLFLIDGTLDLLPDDEALALLDFLCRPEQPWKLVLVTGRELLAAKCNRRVELDS